jgi:hypothetical protein
VRLVLAPPSGSCPDLVRILSIDSVPKCVTAAGNFYTICCRPVPPRPDLPSQVQHCLAGAGHRGQPLRWRFSATLVQLDRSVLLPHAPLLSLYVRRSNWFGSCRHKFFVGTGRTAWRNGQRPADDQRTGSSTPPRRRAFSRAPTAAGLGQRATKGCPTSPPPPSPDGPSSSLSALTAAASGDRATAAAWEEINDGVGDLQAFHIENHPTDPEILFVATASNGVLFSDNSGAGWIFLQRTPTPSSRSTPPERCSKASTAGATGRRVCRCRPDFDGSALIRTSPGRFM